MHAANLTLHDLEGTRVPISDIHAETHASFMWICAYWGDLKVRAEIR